MLISRLMIGACLSAGKWLFLLTGLLAFVALVLDFARGDESGRPDVLLIIAGGCVTLAMLFHFIGRWFDRLIARAE